MTQLRGLQTGIRRALVVSIAWTLLVLGYKTVIDLLGIFDAAGIVEWVMQHILAVWGEGLILGLILSAAIAVSRRNRQPGPLTFARAATLGSLGGILIWILVMTATKASAFSDFWEFVFSSAVILTLSGALIGLGMWRTARPPELLSVAQRDASQRETIFRWSAGVSVAFVADGLLMAWALRKGGYALLGYAQISFLPVFMPAMLVSLVLLVIYARGVRHRSWSVRRSEWGFLLILALAVAAKVVVFVRGDRG